MSPTNQHIDYDKVEDMVEGDDEFRHQLFQAIQVAIKELQVAYIAGIKAREFTLLRQARHKIKPTLQLFGLSPVSRVLGEGKRLIASGASNEELAEHLQRFIEMTDELLQEVERNI